MTPEEFAVRLHHRVVKIHPFRNGNGRHSRLLADLVLSKHFGIEPFTWGGSAQLGTGDPHRQPYLEGLKSADRGDYGPLMKLCRAS
jgi:fido (protein-threonine AMPylation protein)